MKGTHEVTAFVSVWRVVPRQDIILKLMGQVWIRLGFRV